MLRTIRRAALNLSVPAALALPIAIGLASPPTGPVDARRPSPFDSYRYMNYAPDEVVYLLPDRTPIRFGDLPLAPGRPSPSPAGAGASPAPARCGTTRGTPDQSS